MRVPANAQIDASSADGWTGRAAELRRLDEDRWLATRFAGARERDAFTLAALLDLELRRALGLSEAMLGKIRLQWWREALDRGDAASHPLLAPARMLCGANPRFSAALGRYVDAVDAVLDEHLAGPADPEAHVATGLGVEAAATVLHAAALAPDLVEERRAVLETVGAASAAVRAELADAEARKAGARMAARGLPSPLWPAVLRHAPVFRSARSPLARRWAMVTAAARERL